MKPVEVVAHHHVERRVVVPSPCTSNMNVIVVCPSIGQSVDQPGKAMMREYHLADLREQHVEITICNPVRMLLMRLERHKSTTFTTRISTPYLPGARNRLGGKRFKGRHVASAGHHYIGSAPRSFSPIPKCLFQPCQC